MLHLFVCNLNIAAANKHLIQNSVHKNKTRTKQKQKQFINTKSL